MTAGERAGTERMGQAAIRRWMEAAGFRLDAIIEEAQGASVLWLSVAFACGIGAYFSLGQEPPLLLPLFSTILFSVAAIRRRPSGSRLALTLLAAFAGGVAWSAVTAMRHDGPILDRRTGVVTLSGDVITMEDREHGEKRLVIAVHDISGFTPEATPRRVRLSARTDTTAAAPGRSVRLRAVLWPPPPPAFPGDLDFGRELYFQDIGAMGITVSPVASWDAELGAMTSLRARAEQLRLTISTRLREALPGSSGLIADALVTGFRGAMPDALADTMRDAGLAHLLAISGMHMAMVAGIVFFTARALLALIEPWALRYPIKKWAAAIALVAAFAYLMISGGRVPAERAFIMVSLALLAVMIDRRPISMRMVALSAIAVLTLQPMALLSISFQMSFAAVIALVAFYEFMRGRKWVKRRGHGFLARVGDLVLAAVTTTIIAEIAVTPATLFYFGEVPLLGIIANAVAIPLMGSIIMPLLALGVVAMPFGLEELPLFLAGPGINLIVDVAAWTSSHAWATLHFPPMSLAAYLTMMAGGMWIVLWRSRIAFVGILPVMAGIYLSIISLPPDIFIPGDGDLVAVRLENGLFAMPPGRGQGWERERIARWSAGKTAPWPVNNVSEDGRLRCDGLGCSYQPRPGLVVVLPRRADALGDDCRIADVIAADLWLPWGCHTPKVKIGRRERRDNGGHSLWFGSLERPIIKVETVGEKRNGRPWGAPPHPATGKARD